MSDEKVIEAPIGLPTGPIRYIAELGFAVYTFLEPAKSALTHHVPYKFRGDFTPQQLANYDAKNKYRVDEGGYLLCYAKTLQGNQCNRKAKNRWPFCDLHGGKVHPLDKTNAKESHKALTRYRQYQNGDITIEDLDEEELAQCGFRSDNGRIYKPASVPREMVTAFQQAIFSRATDTMRSFTVEAVLVIIEIMNNTKNEPDIRLKAAQIIIERNLGKTPQQISVSLDKPYEEIFENMAHMSREESRQARNIVSDRPNEIEATIVDVPIVEEETAIEEEKLIPVRHNISSPKPVLKEEEISPYESIRTIETPLAGGLIHVIHKLIRSKEYFKNQNRKKKERRTYTLGDFD